MRPFSLQTLLNEKRVVVCLGSGGVGKTTIAAAVGLLAARNGLRVLCLTVDPAKRLAENLGLDAQSGEEQVVDSARLARVGVTSPGSLTAVMLDTKATFDALVEEHAPSAEVADRILSNRLYEYLATSLAGTQSYMAMETLLRFYEDPRFDLIVLDTPPTNHALDFVEAPKRLADTLDSRAIGWFSELLVGTSKAGINWVAKGTALVFRGLGKVTGRGFLEQVAELIVDMNQLFGGFRARAARVAKAFRSPDFGYVFVAIPTPSSLAASQFLEERLQAEGITGNLKIINRCSRHPEFADAVALAEGVLKRHPPPVAGPTADGILTALRDEATVAAREEAVLARLSRSGLSPSIPTVELPLLAEDVHELRLLAELADRLSVSQVGKRSS